MRAITLSLLTLALSAQVYAQTPAGPVIPAAPTQPAPPAETAPPVPAANPAPAPSAAAAKPHGDDQTFVVPAETTIPLILQNTINTKSAFAGEAIYCESIYPITVGNRIVIPKGSSVRGSVTQVLRPGKVKGKALIGLRFDQLILPNGTTVPLRAVLSGFGSMSSETFDPKEGKIGGAGSKGEDVGKIAQTTVSGAELGTLVGWGQGHSLEGLGIGSAAGAAAGVIWVLASRGKDIVMPYGTSLELKLTQPVTFMRYDIEPASNYDSGPALPRREYGPH